MVARTIWSRRTGAMPSLGVTRAPRGQNFLLVVRPIIRWTSMRQDGERVKREAGAGGTGLLVPGAFEVVLELVHEHVGIRGRDDQLVGRDVTAVDPAAGRRFRAPQPADQLHLRLGPDDHGHRADLIRRLAELSRALVQVGAVRGAAGAQQGHGEARQDWPESDGVHSLLGGNLGATRGPSPDGSYNSNIFSYL